MSIKVPLFKIYWDKHDVKAVADVVKRGSSWAIGPNIERFERKLAAYLGRNYCVVFNSGTSALHAVLEAYGIKEGDEVIAPSFTFIATANAPLFVKAIPVFAEIEGITYGLDPHDVERKITSKTKAIIAVHFGGCGCNIGQLARIAKRNRLLLIEDTAESLGAKVFGKRAGSYGDSAVLSFCQNKVITTGEGGAVVADSEKVYDKLKLIRSHGRLREKGYFYSGNRGDYVSLGYNFRMPDMVAALGLSQLKKINRIIDMRRRNAAYLTKRLSGLEEIILPVCGKDYFHVYQMYTIRVKGGAGLRDSLKSYLARKGIMTRIYFYPVHLTRFYAKKLGSRKSLPFTESISAQVLTLPMHPSLSKKEMDYIADSVSRFFRR